MAYDLNRGAYRRRRARLWNGTGAGDGVVLPRNGKPARHDEAAVFNGGFAAETAAVSI